jgi:hypothetical protein
MLIGLLFVALSLRLSIFPQRAPADIRDFALLTFANFLTLTVIALHLGIALTRPTG